MIVPVEIRESAGQPRLHAVLIREGTAARGGLAEVFTPNSIMWPSTGVAVLLEHRGQPVARAMPVRTPDSAIEVDVPASVEMVEAVRSGKSGASIEFFSMQEERTAGGIREISSALISGFALVADPEYATKAEIRSRRFPVWAA